MIALFAMFSLGFIVIVLAHDLYQLVRAIRSLGSTGRKPSANFMTSLGRRSLQAIDNLSFRLTTLEWDAKSTTLPSSPSLRHEINPAAKKGTILETFDSEEFHEQLLSLVMSQVEADVYSLFWVGPGGAPGMLTSGAEGESFQSALKAFGLDYVDRMASSSCTSYSEVFSYYGIDVVFAAPFTQDVLDQSSKGLFLIGYKKPKHPLPGDIRIVREIAREIPQLASEMLLRKRVSAAENLIIERGDFLAHMSHDIRSPLNNIRAALYILRDEGGDDGILNIALSNVDLASDLVETILDYSRHAAGKLSPRKETFQLNSILDEVVSSFRLSAATKGLQLETEFEELLFYISADKRQIKRIVTNLVSNGIKFTDTGKVKVKLSKARDSFAPIISVTDSGRGMSEREQGLLFTPFTRFANNIDGTGLGLALSKGLADLNDLSIDVRSAQLEGSTFTLLFKDAHVVATQEAKHVEVPIPPFILNGLRILVVDDDPLCRESIETLLTRKGAKVDLADGPRQAKEKLIEHQFDALISDGQMPGGGAEEILSFVARRQITLHVSIVTGEDDEGRRQAYIDRGAAVILTKPCDFNRLLNHLSKLTNTGMENSASSHFFEVTGTAGNL